MENQVKKEQELSTIIKQVVHDIRSPLSSLKMIIHCSTELSEDNNKALRAVSDRISDITYNLLKYFKPEHYTDGLSNLNALKPVRVAADLIEIITEKKYEYSLRDIKFTAKFNSNDTTRINLNSQAFKRSISNIINNAVESFESGVGEVIISLNMIDDKVQVIIEDNGKGIPEAVKEKILNNIQVTFGKANGNGIGYTQIQDMLAQNNGTLQMQSKQDVGTKIILIFPKMF